MIQFNSSIKLLSLAKRKQNIFHRHNLMHASSNDKYSAKRLKPNEITAMANTSAEASPDHESRVLCPI